MDATDYDNTKEVLKQSINDLGGRLDVFVANAGIPWTQGRMIDGELSHYKAVVTTDLDSVFYCAKAAGEVFRRQYETGLDAMGKELTNYRTGSFIATSSMSGHIANIPQLQAAVSPSLSNPNIYPNIISNNTPTLVQRRQSRCAPPLQISCGRMGEIRESKLNITRLHRDRNLRLCSA